MMIAFHYPPYSGGSGIHRTLKFSRYLLHHGWQPIMLAPNPRAYPNTSFDQIAEIPSSVKVHRAFALDTGRHLAVRNSYPQLLALPDRWISWFFGAVPAGVRLIAKYRPDVIWSTFPIATAHLIGATLCRLMRIPWVADFRDSMTEDDYPRDPRVRRSYLCVERLVVRHSSCLIFTTDSAREMYHHRYADLAANRSLVIANGYDESDFASIQSPPVAGEAHSRPIRLVHAGLLYPKERDPIPFLRVLGRLKTMKMVDSNSLRVDLRAPGSESYYSHEISKYGIDDLVHLLPALPFHMSLQDCAAADALLLFQAPCCNHQIPAKVYEYLRLNKPILALTSETGDTANLLRECGGATLMSILDEEVIFQALPAFLRSVQLRIHLLPNVDKVSSYSRQIQTAALARCFSGLLGAQR
jgi:glycosyltransferase involved in cell wall biosynthesis